MAVCKRCGTVFSYEKRDGVCPKCCFFNRPEGTVGSDDSWIKNYNYDDNTFEFPKISSEEILEGRKRKEKIRFRPNMDRQNDRNELARKIREAANIERGKTGTINVGRERPAKTARNYNSKKKNPIQIISIIVVLLILILTIVPSVIKAIYEEIRYKNLITENVKVSNSQIEPVETIAITPQEASEGIQAGDVYYTIGDVVTLFEDQELESLPEGEKCIGIWIKDNEDEIEYERLDWIKPYVYDGTYYRDIIDYSSDDDVYDTLEDRYPWYKSDYDNEGYAIYYVDKDAESVTLSLPSMIVDEDGIIQEAIYEVELPIHKNEQ